MAANVGELFVELGIKDAGKTIGALNETRKSLGEAASQSLALKAGILAAMYALTSLTRESAGIGMNLQGFADQTGLSVTALQNLQNAALQFRVSGDTVISTVKGIQNAMMDMQTSGGLPRFVGWMQQAGVAFDQNKIRDTYYVLEKLQEFAKKAPPDLLRNVFGKSGIPDDFGAFLRLSQANMFNNKLGPVESPGMVAANNRVGVHMLNFENWFKHTLDGFTVKHGDQLINDLKGLTTAFLHLGEALTKLAERSHAFEMLDAFIGKLVILTNGFDNDATSGQFVGPMQPAGGIPYPDQAKQEERAKAAMSAIGSFLELDFIANSNAYQSFIHAKHGDLGKWIKKHSGKHAPTFDSNYGPGADMVIPKVNRPGPASHSSNTFHIHQQFSHEGKEPNRIADAAKQGIAQAHRQLPTLGQVV